MTLYEDIKKGLEEAIAYNEGKLAARKTTLSNDPEIPNATTIAAMVEFKKMQKHPKVYPHYSSFNEGVKEVPKDDKS